MKTIAINNRRYLGGKHKLLPFITKVVRENCCGVGIFADMFSGTGAVASAFANKMLITNDILYSNHICNLAWFGPQKFNPEKIRDMISGYNLYKACGENYMTENFSDTFFSREDCSKIGFIREDIEAKRAFGEVNERERALLLTSLLYAMDKIANTCGHYDAYRRGAEFGKQIELSYPDASNGNNPMNSCNNEDANTLSRKIRADLAYLDPPYNSRQYCDAYHLLENVARWEKPGVKGVARKMDRKNLKSKYCTKEAAKSLADLVANLDSKYILLSYNNMDMKGNMRSNAKISDDEIMGILSAKGDVKVFSQSHKAFSAGKSDIKGNEERLFLCTCHR